VARTIEFDEGEALDKAMYLFWEKGFARTSVRDLVEGTGVAHAGLYNVFKDKKGLFIRALEKYASENDDNILLPLEQIESGKQAIENLFDIAVDRARTGIFKNGCFVVNSAAEFGEEDREVQQIVLRTFARQKKAFENAIGNGIAAGEIHPSIQVSELAVFLVSALNGLSTFMRCGSPIESIENTSKTVKMILQQSTPCHSVLESNAFDNQDSASE